ncbi:MAG: Gfo/Idh/MocA family oxidoreductase [Planctomycetes bacterium]|nr:Gfo/Idh/MocA family oxidoreductase [Planctomycetota bacterium]
MSSASGTLRVGLIGAGNNTRVKHIPGLQAVPGVQVVCVANRTVESGQKVAREFGIPRVLGRWQEVIEQRDVDAVVIGTWPYLHAEATCAALDAGKHVLCEARMAMDAGEARRMLAKAMSSGRVAQVVPSPIGLKAHRAVADLVGSGFLGDFYEIHVRALADTFAHPDAPLHWRQRSDLSGMNVLILGLVNETIQRWFGDTLSVTAQAATHIPRRRHPDTGEMTDVPIPDALSVLARMNRVPQAVYALSGTVRHGGPGTIEVFGSRGTMRLETSTDRVWVGSASETQLHELVIPPGQAGGWRVEADFVDAIRGVKPVEFTSFEAGVKYMEFTEAARRSAETGQRVSLPLQAG